MTLKLFHNPQSRATMTHWLLEELGVDYELVRVEYEDGSMRTPEFLSISPLGKIPALLDGEVSVSDTPAIAIYLADKYKTPVDMAPGLDDPRRGDYLRWLIFQGTAIDPAMLQAGLKFETNRRQAGWGDVEAVVDALETRLQTAEPYLFGDWFTAADLLVGGALNWATEFGLMEARPAIERYVDAVTSRPAFAKTIGAD
ncbi:glutathione S-transferase family protein [Maricaulaceae bacterium MS644]